MGAIDVCMTHIESTLHGVVYIIADNNLFISVTYVSIGVYKVSL